MGRSKIKKRRTKEKNEEKIEGSNFTKLKGNVAVITGLVVVVGLVLLSAGIFSFFSPVL